jgi:hypothetical protein
MLLRQNGRLCCISLDSQVIYRYDISGEDGLAVDRQDYIYISGLLSNDIQRLSPDGTFRDIVLSKRDGIDQPFGIAFSNNFRKLFVINCGKYFRECKQYPLNKMSNKVCKQLIHHPTQCSQ